MLVSVEVPDYLESLYEEAKTESARIFEGVSGAGKQVTLPVGEDLLASRQPVYYFIHQGSLELVDEHDRVLRTYSARDIVFGGATETWSGCHILVRDEVQAVRFDRDQFVTLLSSQPELLRRWLDLQALEERILQLLGSVFLSQGNSEAIRVATFEPGDVILEEGTEADEVFVLVDGRASVQAAGATVGRVKAGEMFGEMAFLTGQRRTASVVAETSCVVQIADHDAFVDLVRSRPEVAVEMARGLARRVAALNEKVR